jgi:hypothetical protein
MTLRVRSLALALAVLLGAFPLSAQSWDAVRGLQKGDRVKVLERDGTEHKGAVTSVTPEAVSLATGTTQVSVDRPRVKRVQLHSPSRRVRNIAIGAGIGLALGVVVDQTVGAYLRNESSSTGRPWSYIVPIGLFGGIGAALSPYRTIYNVK